MDEGEIEIDVILPGPHRLRDPEGADKKAARMQTLLRGLGWVPWWEKSPACPLVGQCPLPGQNRSAK